MLELGVYACVFFGLLFFNPGLLGGFPSMMAKVKAEE